MKENEPKKKLCIVTGMHGNEAFLFEPLRRYVEEIKTETGQVEVVLILANKEAAQREVRYLDQDLNRSFGTQLNDNKETRVAKEITGLCADADLIIDLHSHTGKETFSLVSEGNVTKELQLFVGALNCGPCIVISLQVTGGTSLIENLPDSLSIETGEHNSPEAVTFARECVKKAIYFLNQENSNPSLNTRFLRAKKFLKNNSGKEITLSSKINNFVKVAKGTEIHSGFFAEEDYIPALVSYAVKPGKKILLVCEEMVNGGVDNE